MEELDDMDFPSESWGSDGEMVMDELHETSSNLGSILDNLFGQLAMHLPDDDDNQRDKQYSQVEGKLDIHQLPSEIISIIYSCLSSTDDKANLRLASKSLYQCLDESMSDLRIVPGLLPESSLSYLNLYPTWTVSTRRLVIINNNHGLWNQWQQQQRNANGPLFLFLMMLAPRLCNLTHLKVVGDFFLEVLLSIANTGASRTITNLEVKKQMLERANSAAFWKAIDVSFPSLTSLSLSGWMLDLVDVRSLSTLTNLEVLHISHTSNLPDIGLQCLSSLVNLKHLVLEALEYSSPIESEFNGLSSLTKLETMRSITVGMLPEEVQSIARLTTLQNFEISNHYDPELHQPILDLVRSNTGLTTLTLSHFELSSSIIPFLSKLPHLTTLSLGRCSAVKSLPILSTVTHLTLRFLYEFPVEDDQGGDRATLAELCPNLRSLKFSTLPGEGSGGCRLLFSEHRPLQSLTSLSCLASLLSYTELVKGCPRVEKLSLDCSQGLPLQPAFQNEGVADLAMVAMIAAGQDGLAENEPAVAGLPNALVANLVAPLNPDENEALPIPQPLAQQLPAFEHPLSWLESLALFTHLQSLTLTECWSIGIEGAAILGAGLEKLQLQELTLSSLSVDFIERGVERMMSNREGFKGLQVLRIGKVTSQHPSSPVRLPGKSLARILGNVPSIERIHISGLFTVPHFLREQYRRVCSRKAKGGVMTEVVIERSSHDRSFE